MRSLYELEQLNVEGIKTIITELDFCRWLDKKLRAVDIKQEILLEFLYRVIRNLLAHKNLNIAKLWLGRFTLEKVLRVKISLYRKQAHIKGYQQCMFGQQAIVTVNPKLFSFSFNLNNYLANMFYEGSLGFNKHYYPYTAAMNNEEAKCAFLIDQNPSVKFWVRSLERQVKYAFWLPTSTDKFYPDFVVQLIDGRL